MIIVMETATTTTTTAIRGLNHAAIVQDGRHLAKRA